jgi:hypothetical protein
MIILIPAYFFGTSYYKEVVSKVGFVSIPQFAPGYNDKNRVDISRTPPEEFGMWGNNLFKYKDRIYLWSWTNNSACHLEKFISNLGKCGQGFIDSRIMIGYFEQNLDIEELGEDIWNKLDINKYKKLIELPFSTDMSKISYLSKIGEGYHVSNDKVAYVGSLEGGPTIAIPVENDTYSNRNIYIYNKKVYTIEEKGSQIREMSLDKKENSIISYPKSPFCYIDRISSNESGLIQMEESKISYSGIRTNCFAYIIKTKQESDSRNSTDNQVVDNFEDSPSVLANNFEDKKITPDKASIISISERGIGDTDKGTVYTISFDFQIQYYEAGNYILEAIAIFPNGVENKILIDYYVPEPYLQTTNLLLSLNDFGKENAKNGSYSLKNILLYKEGVSGYPRELLVDRYKGNGDGKYISKYYVVDLD